MKMYCILFIDRQTAMVYEHMGYCYYTVTIMFLCKGNIVVCFGESLLSRTCQVSKTCLSAVTSLLFSWKKKEKSIPVNKVLLQHSTNEKNYATGGEWMKNQKHVRTRRLTSWRRKPRITNCHSYYIHSTAETYYIMSYKASRIGLNTPGCKLLWTEISS